MESAEVPRLPLPRSLTRQLGSGGQNVRMKFECSRKQCRQPGVRRKIGYLKDTFFEKLRGSRKKLFLASVLFVDDLGRVEDRALRCNVTGQAIIQWDQWFRDVIVKSFFENDAPRKIGGPGTVLQIEETYTPEAVYGRCRLAADNWVVMGIIESSKEIFLEIASKRDAATLDSIITKHVSPGTIIGNLGYVHRTVDHEEVVDGSSSDVQDPKDRAEDAWSRIQQTLKRLGLEGALSDDHFLESVWKWQHRSEPKLYLLWSEISKQYPLAD